MTARDIINAACAKVNKSHDHTYATAVLAALSAAGYFIAEPGDRIVKAGELDGETLETASKIVDVLAGIMDRECRFLLPAGARQLSAALRALRESGG